MDVIADLLDGVRARGGVFGRPPACPPWSLRFVAPGRLWLATMVAGRAWVVAAGGGPRALGPGDVVLARGERPFVIADPPQTPPQIVVHGDECRGEFGAGGGAQGGALLVTGACRLGGELPGRLLAVLPDLLVVPGGDVRLAPVLELVGAEAAGVAPGRQVVLERLLETLLVVTVRAWFAREEAGAPLWYTALEDPRIGRVLRMIHAAPASGWTVVSLAGAAGMSRAAFARRFTALVGRPPLAYVTEWRMALAAELLARPGTTVAVAARQVGYADAFGFSAAFKRVRGVSPGAVRAGG
ncbi:AraC family transcriptional regulator [Streptosporangium roseum]|uniref:Transcriptional regulator, AraC family n=1 Tax=Streptosporangium roseum (strain ATCC 12428 / DSM 43021 / JCM 3005 / KCTC 9067 / NCIMB 10171 / NRRL 2505 / NI 9100) TaxID=479432 RepID=D2B1L5_STRRD|nr:AraC family transcriptional regulator [Streptosporangium roseum]ACZ87317.1 transcriptional regulator, AraC family [Streptosporangium roseum DSM 43021]